MRRGKTHSKAASCAGLHLQRQAACSSWGSAIRQPARPRFITALYVVIVPVFGLIFLQKKVRPVIWLCVIASAIGLYLLCIPAGGGFSNLNKGDMIMPICAIMFAIHILIIDNFSPKTDGVRLSCIHVPDRRYRFALLHMAGSAYRIFPADTGCCALKLAAPDLHRRTFMRRGIHFPDNRAGRYRSDRRIDDTCLESVFAVIAGMLLLGESMDIREIIGCVIMFVAIVVAQLPEKPKAEQAVISEE